MIVAVLGYISAVLILFAGINLGLFIKPMGEAIGISAAVFGWAGTVRALCGAVSSPLLGRLMDEHGPRYLLALAVLLGAICILLLAHVTETWQFLALFGVLGLVGMIGPAQLFTIVPITKWFIRQRGRAISLMFLGAVLGPAILLPVNQIAIDRIGWSATWTIIGLVAITTVIPLSILFLRRQPEDMGLLPDGDILEAHAEAHSSPHPNPLPEGEGARIAPLPLEEVGQGREAGEGRVRAGRTPALGTTEEISWTRGEAIRTGAFWRIGLAYSLFMFAGTSYILFRIPYFVELGMDPIIVAAGASLDALMFGITSVVAGFLEHRMSVRRLASLGLVGVWLSVMLVITGDSVGQMLLANALWGASAGVSNLAQQLMWASYFGRGHQGSIRGVVATLTVTIGSLSGPIVGMLREATGAYASGWWIASGLVFVAVLLVAMTPPPRWRGRRRPAQSAPQQPPTPIFPAPNAVI